MPLIRRPILVPFSDGVGVQRDEVRKMSKSRHTEAEVIGALKQIEAGRKAEDGAKSGRVEAHRLRLEGEVRRDGRKPDAGGEAVAG